MREKRRKTERIEVVTRWSEALQKRHESAISCRLLRCDAVRMQTDEENITTNASARPSLEQRIVDMNRLHKECIVQL